LKRGKPFVSLTEVAMFRVKEKHLGFCSNEYEYEYEYSLKGKAFRFKSIVK
jgi:hypothetical protein